MTIPEPTRSETSAAQTPDGALESGGMPTQTAADAGTGETPTYSSVSAATIEQPVATPDADAGTPYRRDRPVADFWGVDSERANGGVDTSAAPAPAAADEDGRDANEASKEKHWMESPYAVGLVNVRWADEQVPVHRCCTTGVHHTCLSGYVCGCLGAGRVGNLVVFLQGEEEYDHESINDQTEERTVTRRKRPTLLWVVGPYWWMNLFITYPLIIGLAYWTIDLELLDGSVVLLVCYIACVAVMLFALTMVSCRNPGVQYRYTERPPGPEGQDWRWNDQARTYRPVKARFDPECGVVIEGFDHTCPWTGTAIGSRNMFWFRVFTTMVPAAIAFTIFVHALL